MFCIACCMAPNMAASSAGWSESSSSWNWLGLRIDEVVVLQLHRSWTPAAVELLALGSGRSSFCSNGSALRSFWPVPRIGSRVRCPRARS